MNTFANSMSPKSSGRQPVLRHVLTVEIVHPLTDIEVCPLLCKAFDIGHHVLDLICVWQCLGKPSHLLSIAV